jgi:hypothetical protein
LSLNVWPKTFSIGHASWHAEHGSPYFRANAGIAFPGVGLKKKISGKTSNARMLAALARRDWKTDLLPFEKVVRPICIAMTSQSQDG